MKVTLICNESGSRLLHDEPNIQRILGDLISYLELVDDTFERSSNSSKNFRVRIAEFFKEWNVNLLVQRDFPSRKFPSSHVRVDFQKELESQNKDGKLQITAELFADNRQAIAANLLKFELAGRNFSMFGRSLGIGITIGKNLKNDGWDTATASSEEYEYALLHTYAGVINEPIALLSVNLT